MSSTGLEVSERRGVGANISALAGGQVVTWSMSLAWTLVVSRLLGPAGMGLLVTATSVTAIAGVLLGLGARDFLVREIVANRLDGLRLAGSTIVLRAGLFPLYAAAVVAYGRYAHLSAEARTVLYLEAGATMLILLKEPLQATFQGIERMQYLALGDIFDTTTRSLVGIGLAVLGFGGGGCSPWRRPPSSSSSSGRLRSRSWRRCWRTPSSRCCSDRATGTPCR